MQSWAEVLAALNNAALLIATIIVGWLGVEARALVPMALNWLKEKITASATARLTPLIEGAAARIVDPTNSSTSILAEASKIASTAKLAMANSGSTIEGVQAAIDKAVSGLKVAPGPEVKS